MKKADAKRTGSNPPGDTGAVPTDVAEAAGAPTELTPEQVSTEQLSELRSRAAKADENWERLLRTAADFENFKKRATRERQEAAQNATAALVHKLLPVLDHFEMAQAATQTAQAPDTGIAALQNGISMIQQQLKSILAETGVEEVNASGKPFDPMLHEAVSQLETSEAPEGQVIHQIRKGYKLRERLLRPATVVVAKNPTSSSEAPSAV